MEQVAKLREIAENSGTVAEFVFDLIKIWKRWELPSRLQAVSEAQAEEGI